MPVDETPASAFYNTRSSGKSRTGLVPGRSATGKGKILVLFSGGCRTGQIAERVISVARPRRVVDVARCIYSWPLCRHRHPANRYIVLPRDKDTVAGCAWSAAR